MDVATALKIAKAAGEKAAKTVKELVYDEGQKIGKAALIIGLIICVINLPNIFVVGLFAWMDSDYVNEDSINIELDRYATLNSPVLLIIYHPDYPFNIPWPDDTLQFVCDLNGLSWTETEMCNVIYHAYVKNLTEEPEDSTGLGAAGIIGGIINAANLSSTYNRIAKCFKEADTALSYNSRLFNEFGFELTDDEYRSLNHELGYTPPDEEDE